jgi:hypothetical protein
MTAFTDLTARPTPAAPLFRVLGRSLVALATENRPKTRRSAALSEETP